MDLEKAFGDNLRLRLEKKEITQETFAKALNVNQPTISRLINGKQLPDFILALKIADYFDLNLYEFMGLPTPNVVKENSMFNKFLCELHELIYRYVRPKNASFNFETDPLNNSISKFMVSHEYSAKSMYPQQGDSDLWKFGNYNNSDDYLIVNGNIYPKQYAEILQCHEHLSFYDYVNSISDHKENHLDLNARYKHLRKMMNVFAQNRYLFGILGTLSVSKFYWLVYLLSYKNKLVSDITE